MGQNVSAEAGSSPDQSDPVAPARGLKIAVIVMGVILIVGFAVVFITIAYRVANSPALTSSRPAPEASFETAVPIPAGAEITGVEFLEDRALVKVRGVDDTYMVIVLDIDKGTALGRFVLKPE